MIGKSVDPKMNISSLKAMQDDIEVLKVLCFHLRVCSCAKQ